MIINLTLEGTPDRCREAIASVVALNDPDGGVFLDALDQQAGEILERAVKDGSATIHLGTPTESEKLTAAGCL